MEVDDPTTLLVPDRPGNKILMGLQNIIENPKVGICFEIPGTCTTLRIGGTAIISKDPELLSRLAARGLDATVVIVVTVQYAFFHCAKAYLRSRLWDPHSWGDEYSVQLGESTVSLSRLFVASRDGPYRFWQS